MGFAFKYRKFVKNSRSHTRLLLFLDSPGDALIAIRDIAMEICANADEVFSDIVELPENSPSRTYLWEQYGYPYLREMEKNAESGQKAWDFLKLAAIFADEDKPGPHTTPSGYINAKDTRYSMGIILVQIRDGNHPAKYSGLF